MERIKQSFSWTFFGGSVAAEQLVRTAVDIGYAAIDFVPSDYWQLVRDHGLAIAAIEGHRSIEEGLNRREHHARIEAELRAKLAMAQQWNIPNLIVFSGNRAGLDDYTGAEITAEGLRRVAKAAEDAGINLVLELLNSKINHGDYQADHVSWGLEVCRMVASPRVRLLYDIYHMQVMEGDVIRTITEHAAYFAHYHTAGNPGRHDLDDTQELQYPAIMRAILLTGFDGYVAHEFSAKGDPLAALVHAYQVCDVKL